jgi:hypothetical protein
MLNPFVTSGTYMSHLQRDFSSLKTFSPCCHLPWSISIPLNQSECIFPRNSRVQMILCAMLHASKWLQTHSLGWVHTCNVTAYRNTVSWQCGRDSCPRNVSKIGYAVMLRYFSVCYRCLAVTSKGWYGYGLCRCGRATWRCTSTPAHTVTVSSLWWDGQTPIAHRKNP